MCDDSKKNPIIFSIINNFVSDIDEIEFDKNLFIIRHDNSNNSNFRKKIGEESIGLLDGYLDYSKEKIDDGRLVAVQYGIDKIHRSAKHTRYGILYHNFIKDDKQDLSLLMDKPARDILSALRILKDAYISLYPVVLFGYIGRMVVVRLKIQT